MPIAEHHIGLPLRELDAETPPLAGSRRFRTPFGTRRLLSKPSSTTQCPITAHERPFPFYASIATLFYPSIATGQKAGPGAAGDAEIAANRVGLKLGKKKGWGSAACRSHSASFPWRSVGREAGRLQGQPEAVRAVGEGGPLRVQPLLHEAQLPGQLLLLRLHGPLPRPRERRRR